MRRSVYAQTLALAALDKRGGRHVAASVRGQTLSVNDFMRELLSAKPVYVSEEAWALVDDPAFLPIGAQGRFLPFPHLWVEWDTPGPEEGRQGAMLLRENPDDRRRGIVSLFSLMPGAGADHSRSIVGVYECREDGVVTVQPAQVYELAEDMSDTVGPMILSIMTLMNTPGMIEMHAGPVASRVRREIAAKKGVPIVEVPTIRLSARGRTQVETMRAEFERGEARHRALHDVRGHLRRLASGRVVQVRSHKRGDERLGLRLSSYEITG